MPDCPPVVAAVGRVLPGPTFCERRYPSGGREPSNARADTQVCRAAPRPRPRGHRSCRPRRSARRGGTTTYERPPTAASRAKACVGVCAQRRDRHDAGQAAGARPPRPRRRSAGTPAAAPPPAATASPSRSGRGRPAPGTRSRRPRARGAAVERADQPHAVDRVDDVGVARDRARPCWSAAARRSASEIGDAGGPGRRSPWRPPPGPGSPPRRCTPSSARRATSLAGNVLVIATRVTLDRVAAGGVRRPRRCGPRSCGQVGGDLGAGGRRVSDRLTPRHQPGEASASRRPAGGSRGPARSAVHQELDLDRLDTRREQLGDDAGRAGRAPACPARRRRPGLGHAPRRPRPAWPAAPRSTVRRWPARPCDDPMRAGAPSSCIAATVAPARRRRPPRGARRARRAMTSLRRAASSTGTQSATRTTRPTPRLTSVTSASASAARPVRAARRPRRPRRRAPGS